MSPCSQGQAEAAVPKGVPMNLRVARIVAVVAVAVTALALAPLAAAGSPIDDKKAEAARLQAAIDSNGTKIDALSEQYNGAVYRLQQLDGQIAEAQTRVKAAQENFDKLKSVVSTRAASLYMGAGTSDPLARHHGPARDVEGGAADAAQAARQGSLPGPGREGQDLEGARAAAGRQRAAAVAPLEDEDRHRVARQEGAGRRTRGAGCGGRGPPARGIERRRQRSRGELPDRLHPAL